MKHLFLSIVGCFTLLISSCQFNRIDGNGISKTESRTITETYTGVDFAGSGDVEISYGKKDNIEVTADENLLQYIETKVKNGVLEIGYKRNKNIHSKTKIHFHVYVTKLNKIELAGSGSIVGNGNFETDDKTSIELAGSGNIQVNYTTINHLKLEIAGSGNVVLSGISNNSDIEVAGSGEADCRNLQSKKATVSIAGSGDIKLTATETLDVSIAGSGNVIYDGNATVTKSITGSGKLRKVN